VSADATIQIIGAGPAGSSAAISATQNGARVQLIERSHFPRHKVCGEFLSPEIVPVLDRLGVWSLIEAQGAARIRRVVLHFGERERGSRLSDTAFGFSRYALDDLIFQRAIELGAEPQADAMPHDGPIISAAGRNQHSPRGHRLFGFKAHFTGPADDAVELFFFERCYVGVTTVENGITNVCGLGPESLLARMNFDIDDLVSRCRPLAERLSPLSRSMKWLNTGPLIFRNQFRDAAALTSYPAGDALSFVDPFTGSGLASATITGELAGQFAAGKRPIEEYVARCRAVLHRPFEVSSLFRAIASTRLAAHLSGLVPADWLFRLTRPNPA
jgi:flavin-dependent dehydrogenase